MGRVSDPARIAETVATVRAAARALGYALGEHGSRERDLDLIAVPWVEDAAPPESLVEAIRAAVGGVIITDPTAPPEDYTRRNPERKPHGRLAWSIHAAVGVRHGYIDLSVMPRRES